jgi:hypothetical protein
MALTVDDLNTLIDTKVQTSSKSTYLSNLKSVSAYTDNVCTIFKDPSSVAKNIAEKKIVYETCKNWFKSITAIAKLINTFGDANMKSQVGEFNTIFENYNNEIVKPAYNMGTSKTKVRKPKKQTKKPVNDEIDHNTDNDENEEIPPKVKDDLVQAPKPDTIYEGSDDDEDVPDYGISNDQKLNAIKENMRRLTEYVNSIEERIDITLAKHSDSIKYEIVAAKNNDYNELNAKYNTIKDIMIPLVLSANEQTKNNLLQMLLTKML